MCTALLLSSPVSQRLTPSLSHVFDIKQGLKVSPSPTTELGVTLVLCVPHLTSFSSYCTIRQHLVSLYFTNNYNDIHCQFIQFHQTAVSNLPQNLYWLRRRETANKNKGFKFAYGEQIGRSEVLMAVLLMVS
jgi:hypothetical protein